MENTDIITTVNGGVRSSETVAASDALLGFESGNRRPPDDLAVDFVDYPFTKDDVEYADHLAVVKRERPKYAVAPDVDSAAQLDRAIEQADELAEYADVVIMVPKGVHPTEIPDRHRVGLPLANWDKRSEDVEAFVDTTGEPSFHQWTDYADAESVHLLGGSPTLQLEVAKYGVPVASVDGSAIFRAAEYGDVWAPEPQRNWHPTHNEEMDFYERLAASLSNIVAAWSGSDDYTVPTDPDDYAAYLVANRRAESIRSERRQYESGGQGAPPRIAEDEAALWGPGEADQFETYDRYAENQEIEQADQEALAALESNFDQPTLDAFGSQPVAATDGGSVDDATMYYVKTTLGDQPWLDGENVLLSAGVAWRNPGDGFTLEPPENPESLFIDSGGYQAAVHFQDEYPYTATELFEYAESVGADYVAGMDWACESAESLAALYDGIEPEDIAPIEDRLERSIDDQIKQLEAYENGDWSFELVPVVQGYNVDQYRYSARRLRQANLARPYMGIGTVCKRTTADEIREVLNVCKEELPATEFHLFGATKEVWNDRRFWGQFRSADTHAWALKTPEGEWTMTNADKIRAYESYSADIEAIRDQMAEQSTFSTANASRAFGSALLAVGAKRCICGTCIPAYSYDYEPGCRHCERTKINRFDAALAAADEAKSAMSDNNDTYDPTTEWSDGQQGLGGGPAEGQANFAAPEKPKEESKVESVDEVNEGGLMADTRDDTGGDVVTDQGTLFDPTADQLRDDDQGGLDAFESDDDTDPDADGLAAFGMDAPPEPPEREPDPAIKEKEEAQRRGRIKHHAEKGDMRSLLSTLDVDARMDMVGRFADEGIESPADLVAHFDENGDVLDVDAVGPAANERIEDALPLIREAVGDAAVSGENEYPTYTCSDCGDEVENSPRPVSRCIYCGGDMEVTDAGTGPEDDSTPTIYAAERDRWPLLSPYDHKDTAADDLPGIGKTTAKKLDSIKSAEIAEIASIEDTDTLRSIGAALPSDDAVETLVDAVEQSAEKYGMGTPSVYAIREGFAEPEPEQDDADASDRDKLLTVDGIGPKKADTLLDAFGDLDGVIQRANSSTVSIARLDGFSPTTAGQLSDDLRDAGLIETKEFTDPPAPDDPAADLPETVAGYQLTESDPDEGIEWVGENGGSPSLELSRETGWTTKVWVTNHGGRYSYKWTTRVKMTDGDGKSYQNNVMTFGYAGTDGPEDATKRNLSKGIERAVEWMKENPADGADMDQLEYEQEIEELANQAKQDMAIAAQPIPQADRYADLWAAGISPDELPQPDEREPPEADKEEFNRVMAAVYDPTDEAPGSGPRLISVTADADQWRAVVSALGLLRRDWSSARADADGWTRDDIGRTIKRIKERSGQTVELLEKQIDLLWHATSHATAEKKAKRDLMDFEGGPLLDATPDPRADSEPDTSANTADVVEAIETAIMDGETVIVEADGRKHTVSGLIDIWTESGGKIWLGSGTYEGSQPVKVEPDSMTWYRDSAEWADDADSEPTDDSEDETPVETEESDSGESEPSEQDLPDAAYLELYEGAEDDPMRPPEEIEMAALPDELPTELNGWQAAPTGYTAVRYVADVAEGAVMVTAEVQKKVGGEPEYALDVWAFEEDGELVDTKTGTPPGELTKLIGDAEMIQAAADYMERETPKEAFDSLAGTPFKVEFGKLSEANEWRDSNSQHLHRSDTRRTKTVSLVPTVADDIKQDAEEAALISKGDETKSYGQSKLTDAERKQLQDRDNWAWSTNGFQAQAVKAMMRAEGVDDWISFYDPNLTTDEHRSTVLPTAIEDGGGATFEREKSVAEAARQAEKFEGEMCKSARNACESGEPEACDALLEDCGYSEDEVESLIEAVEDMGEDPAAVIGTETYDPLQEEMDEGPSFDEWAASAEPEMLAPTADEIAELAPPRPTVDDYDPEMLEQSGIEMDDSFEFEPLPTAAQRAIGKAWSGYRLSRVDATEAREKAEKYAEVINGIRLANGLRPLQFNELEGLEEKAHVPDDPGEKFPTESGKKSLIETARQVTMSAWTGEVYDPTGEF